MKIISKYKDYYDFLTGIYGEDPILVLDRRNSNQPYIYIEDKPKYKELWIGNYVMNGFLYNGSFYWGENIFQIPKMLKQERLPFYEDAKKNCVYYNNKYETRYWGNGGGYVYISPTKAKRPQFLPDDIVIGLGDFKKENGFYDYFYPILKDLELNKFVKAEEVYRMITEYLSEQILKKEQHLDIRTDIQKLEGKGFDKKKSFRGKL